jgi:hypothetical protein
MNSPSSRSIPELFSEAMGQLAKLMGNEFDLARAELSAKVNQGGRAVAIIGAGAVILIPALVMLMFAAVAGLMHAGISDPVAYLIVGVVGTVISAGFIAAGLNRLSGDALKPSMTLDQVHRDKVAAKEMVR